MAGAEALIKTEAPPFHPRFPWMGGDLQTLRNYIMVRPVDLSDAGAERCGFATTDGSGDVLLAMLHRPPDARSGRPLVMLVHGLSGCEDSVYILNTARHLLDLGYPVLRVNLRGAGPSRAGCRHSYHAGRSEDLWAIVAGLDPALTASGIVPIGYSLGGNAVAKMLAEAADKDGLRLAVLVSTPIDLAESSRRLEAPRNFLYHRWLLARLVEEHLASPDLTSSDGIRARTARSLREFDDRITAPRNGYGTVATYYDQCSATRYLPDVSMPLLVIHARDDPWIPATAYRAFDWASNPMLQLHTAPSGGHVGFHVRGSGTPWHDQLIGAFLSDRIGD